MREHLTDALDTAALVLVAAGAGFAAGHWIGWAGLAVSGVVIGVGSWFAQWLPARRARGGN